MTKINSWRTAWRSLLTKYFADEDFLLYSTLPFWCWSVDVRLEFALVLWQFYRQHKPLKDEIDAYGDFLQGMGTAATDEVSLLPWRLIFVVMHLSIASPTPPPPPSQETMVDLTALPGGGEFDHKVGYRGGAHWPTPVCTVISACTGVGLFDHFVCPRVGI